jgi:hypothetical protein
MDLKQLKEIMEREGGKVIIVENNEPILIVSLFKEKQRKLTLEHSFSLDANSAKDENSALEKKPEIEKEQKIIQGTELLTKEEMPSDELTVEDLPF